MGNTKKIKKFKINISVPTIERKLASLGLSEDNPSFKKTVETEIENVCGLFTPACVYETFNLEVVSSEFKPDELNPKIAVQLQFSSKGQPRYIGAGLTQPFPKKGYPTGEFPTGEFGLNLPQEECVAFSFYVASLGEGSGLASIARANQIAKVVIQEAEEQAVRFVYRLIREEAKKENCLLTPPSLLKKGEIVKKVWKILGAQRIGVTAQSMGIRTGVVGWLSGKKQKK